MSPADVRRVERFFTELTEARPEAGGRLQVLHEDRDLAVVFKPPGVHSTAWSGTRKRWGELTLSDALPLLLSAPTPTAAGEGVASLPAPQPAHRLDARVSGVIAVAKTRRALAELSRLFRERRVTKVYRAIVVGEVRLDRFASGLAVPLRSGEGGEGGEGGGAPDEGALAAGRFTCTLCEATPPAATTADRWVRVEQIGDDGRRSATEVRVLGVTPCAVHGALSTLELRPLTGRRHQLRLACAVGLGAPIVGDDLYHAAADAARAAAAAADAPDAADADADADADAPQGGGPGLPPLPPVRRRAGLFLQAVELSLPHPVTGEPVRVRAPEMARFEKLRARAASGAGFSDDEWDAWRSE